MSYYSDDDFMFSNGCLIMVLAQWFPTGEEFLPREEFYLLRGGISTFWTFKDFNLFALWSIFVFQNYCMHFIKLVQLFSTREVFFPGRISTHLGKKIPHFQVYMISIWLHLVHHLSFRMIP